MEYIPSFDFTLIFYLFIVFASAAFLQLLYLIFIYGRFAFYRRRKQEVEDYPSVSLVIAARNESDNLFKNLPSILEQDYPSFEVIVINHQSIDDSNYILQAYQQVYPHLKVVQVEKNQHLRTGKKLPLTLGIKSAQHEHLLFTDADCVPASNQWLKKMARNFTVQKQIVIGYGPYKKEPGLLNSFIRMDTAFIAVNYFSLALARVPYMGVGRNLAYTKSLFNKNGGFKSHYSISSGDDDLFIQEAAGNKNYTIENDPDTYCYSDAKKTWTSYREQKARHYTTTERYKVIKKAVLGIYPLSLLIMYISFVTLLFDREYRWISLAVFSFLLIIKWIIQGRCLAKIREHSFIALFPLLDIVYACVMPYLYYTTDKSTAKKWK